MTRSKSVLKKVDCLVGLKKVANGSVDLIYLDPPFFSGKVQCLSSRNGEDQYSFDDVWKSSSAYGDFLIARCAEMHRVLKDTGSIFLHCDRSANHIARLVLDLVFGAENFQSEIIWSYKRWSNSKKGLIPNHQNIYFYSKTKKFKFNKKLTEYSETTNVDQLLQLRKRDSRGKSVYLTDDMGVPKPAAVKEGVPLGDVWDIPFLNPKAKERVGYPTQKPLLLLERILELCSDVEDMVLDPFCGSGTTLVAAKLLGRDYIGFDTSPDAIQVSKDRLSNPVRTESALMSKGRNSYIQVNTDALDALKGLDFNPVQRNKGIDAILKKTIDGRPILVRVQREDESIDATINALTKAVKVKNAALGLLIRCNDHRLLHDIETPECLEIVDATSYSVRQTILRAQLTVR